MKRWVGLLLCLCACQAQQPGEDPPEERRADPGIREPAPAPTAESLPDGCIAVGRPTLEKADLAPRAAWRELRARLTTVRADSRRWGRDVLVSFEPGAVHVTRRDGSRTTWLLPAELELEVRTPHVIVRNDLTLDGFRADAVQVAAGEEITIAIVRWRDGAGQKTESGLIIKGGKAFRSITPR